LTASRVIWKCGAVSLFALPHRFLRGGQQLLGFLAGVDVLDHGDEVQRSPLAVALGGDGEHDPGERPILADIALFERGVRDRTGDELLKR
jgi:hypothetical protein